MSRPNVNVGSLDDRPRPDSEYRYGIFIRPPAEIALPTLELMRTVRDLFGFHAAMAYPPHITLIGSIVLDGTEDELIQAIDAAVAHREAIAVHGSGLNARIGAAVGIDYNCLQNGELNEQLADLYDELRESTQALRGFEPTDRKADARRNKEAREHFRAHLTVLGHDGIDNSHLRNEARDFLEPLSSTVPTDWTARTITLYRFWSAAWDDKYWLSQEWLPLTSWTLAE